MSTSSIIGNISDCLNTDVKFACFKDLLNNPDGRIILGMMVGNLVGWTLLIFTWTCLLSSKFCPGGSKNDNVEIREGQKTEASESVKISEVADVALTTSGDCPVASSDATGRDPQQATAFEGGLRLQQCIRDGKRSSP